MHTVHIAGVCIGKQGDTQQDPGYWTGVYGVHKCWHRFVKNPDYFIMVL